MTLNFPNASRSFDARGHVIRFWGHDSSIEVPFFVEAGALCMLEPQTRNEEAAYLRVFDGALDRIREAARKAYKRGRKGSYVLAAADFES